MTVIAQSELKKLRSQLNVLIGSATSNINLFSPLEKELLPNLFESLSFIIAEAQRRAERSA